jgi:hypothetical protein
LRRRGRFVEKPHLPLTEEFHVNEVVVPLADVLNEMEGLIHYYIRLAHPSLALFVACWIANTYAFETFRYCGYLGIRSATPQCGKTRLLRLIAVLSNGNPKVMTCPTAAVLFRCGRNVLLIDEVDRLRNQDKDSYGAILSILNSGFEKGSEIERNERVSKSNGGAVSDTYQLRSYPIYGPKAFAGIEELADTLADRTFFVQMVRSHIRMPRLNMKKTEARFEAIRTRLSQWFKSNMKSITDQYDALPDEVPELKAYDDRFQDVLEPLYVIGKVADDERGNGKTSVVTRFLDAVAVVAGRRMRSERERALVALLRYVNARQGQSDDVFIHTETLLAKCMEAVELSGIKTGAALADFLGNFGLSPTRDRTGDRRGYMFRRDWVEGLMKSYGDRPDTPLQSVNVSEAGSYSGDSPSSQVSDDQTL